MSYVYLIQSGIEFYKIGVANDPVSRLAQLQTGNPHKLEIVACYEFPNADVVEKALHQAFEEKRYFLEWFRISGADFDRFKQICELLGGVGYPPPIILTETDVEDAEDISSPSSGGKWDYHAMFSDGWRIAVQDSRGLYWSWKKATETGRKTLYGGKISDLPYPIEEMRTSYGNQE